MIYGILYIVFRAGKPSGEDQMSGIAQTGAKLTAGIVVALGIWLLASPFLFGYPESSYLGVANGVVVAVLLIECGSWILVAPGAGSIQVSRVEACCGLWLVLSPRVLAYQTPLRPGHNHMIVGAVILVVALAETCLSCIPSRSN